MSESKCKVPQRVRHCRTPVEPYIWPLNPIQYPGLTVCFQIFTFVLIDLLSPVKWPTGSHGVKG